jgi:hypothetical protein
MHTDLELLPVHLWEEDNFLPGNHHAATAVTIQVMEVLARPRNLSQWSNPRRAALASIQEGKSWDWIFGKFELL